MATLLDFRRRIRSVKNTQQITRAMKFVAAARLRRAQESALAARPYSQELAKLAVIGNACNLQNGGLEVVITFRREWLGLRVLIDTHH